MATDGGKSLTRRERAAREGLRLPLLALNRLQESGIYCVPRLSVVVQRSTGRHLIGAHESGGAVADLGIYSAPVSPDGTPLPWLVRIETIGVNGLHARVLAPALARVHIFRVQHTYQILITKHELKSAVGSDRPELSSEILFAGRHGTLEMDLWTKDGAFRGRVCPIFYGRGGDPLKIPSQFEAAVNTAVAAVTCCGCTHCHLLIPPATNNIPAPGTQPATPEDEDVLQAT